MNCLWPHDLRVDVHLLSRGVEPRSVGGRFFEFCGLKGGGSYLFGSWGTWVSVWKHRFTSDPHREGALKGKYSFELNTNKPAHFDSKRHLLHRCSKGPPGAAAFGFFSITGWFLSLRTSSKCPDSDHSRAQFQCKISMSRLFMSYSYFINGISADLCSLISDVEIDTFFNWS